MDWNSAVRVSWKIFAILIVPLLILGIILIVHGSSSSSGTPGASDGGGNREARSQRLTGAGSDDGNSKLWSNHTVPYVIDPLLISADLLIRNAFKLIHEKTCIRFTEKEPNDKYYVRFVRNDDTCFTSQIGRHAVSARAGQEIELGLDCATNANIQRALGLVLGLGFEETRVDREKYVHYNPLRQACINRLEKYGDELTPRNATIGISRQHSQAALNIVFDYVSHMLLAKECFSPLKTNTIRLGSADDADSGQLSVLDLEKLNAMYGCPDCNSYRFMSVHQLMSAPHPFERFNPIEAGYDIDHEAFHVCRVYHGGALLIGKMKTTDSHTNCWVADGGREYIYGRNFEVLTSPEGYNFTWAPQNEISPNAIVGGRTNDREPLYIGKCKISSANSVISGSYLPRVGSLFVPFGGNAVKCSNFQLLTC